jgi:hypothetical protein
LPESPEHVSETALLNELPCGVTFTVELPEPPEARVIVDGLTLRVRLGLLLLPQLSFACTAVDIWFVMPGFPIACT